MKKLICTILLCSFCTSFVYSATYTFTGSYNSDWTNAMNWKSPAGQPRADISRHDQVRIVGTCFIPQGITIRNYGEIHVTNDCLRFDFYTIQNYGKVQLDQSNVHQALGSTFENHRQGILLVSPQALHQFCRVINNGSIQSVDLFAQDNMDAVTITCEKKR
jgi:hypothetical protein